MESGDPSVSLDLLVRTLLALGTSSKELARIISKIACSQKKRCILFPSTPVPRQPLPALPYLLHPCKSSPKGEGTFLLIDWRLQRPPRPRCWRRSRNLQRRVPVPQSLMNSREASLGVMRISTKPAAARKLSSSLTPTRLPCSRRNSVMSLRMCAGSSGVLAPHGDRQAAARFQHAEGLAEYLCLVR